MKAIICKYHPATGPNGARISATDSDKNRVYISYPDDASHEEKYRRAAVKLCEKMKWSGAETLVGGSLGTMLGHSAYVFTFPPVTDPVLPLESLAMEAAGFINMDARIAFARSVVRVAYRTCSSFTVTDAANFANLCGLPCGVSLMRSDVEA